MKQTILLLLTILFLSDSLIAQDIECTFCAPQRQSRTQANFNATYINHRHIVTLERGNKMVVEMFNINDYDMLQDVKKLLSEFSSELQPLRDSLATHPSGHLRIDYAYSTAADFKKIRIKKYEPDGRMFLTNNNGVSYLKVEQDTIRILIEKAKNFKFNGIEYKNHQPVQLTLVLNNYTEVDSLIKNSATLQHFLDTMKQVATPKYKVYAHSYKTTINFHPYPDARERFSGKYRFIFFEGVLTDEYAPVAWVSKFVLPARFAFAADIGAGLIGSRIAPMAEAGFEYRFRKMRGGDYVTLARIMVAPSFLFSQSPTGNIIVHDNWFLNVELGSMSRVENNDYAFTKTTVGIGYLVKPNGNYLTGTTMKAYLNFPIKNQFYICPEIIATNDFKTIFPAVTFKGFFNRD